MEGQQGVAGAAPDKVPTEAANVGAQAASVLGATVVLVQMGEVKVV